MADLDFNIQINSQTQPNAVPQSKTIDQSTTSFLSRAGHPQACIFHLVFKAACLFCYLFLNILLNNSTITFISVVLLAAVDFWTVQNVTGRLLVGLRWRSQIKEDGSEEWIFESFDEDTHNNSIDSYVFWGALVGSPVVWGIFFLANALTFTLFWTMLVLVCLILSSVNLYGYWKCRKDHNQKLSGLLQRGVMAAASQALRV